ncbi:hypothetical protein DdX_14938 [Ditylenchus destructor]|uniref:Uncharacterized protein n=1 Tax=Ditylenchus destructor TaxID=166010 RepID=A0AAD4R1B1_9BILA|nr:hypothetical protein DdX_14938 [Ditylenchus destructor]
MISGLLSIKVALWQNQASTGSRDTDSSSPGQFITRDNSSPATIHHLRQFITCDNSSPGQFITCDNSSPATIHHP